MMRSMTGYGNSVIETAEQVIRVEIKSLNSRGLDLSIRVPKLFSEKEITLRSHLSQVLQRGKVSVYIDIENNSTGLAKKVINREVLRGYYSELKAFANSVGASVDNIIPAIVGLAEFTQSSSAETAEIDWDNISACLDEAIRNFDKFRLAEGAALKQELVSYSRNILEMLKKIEAKKNDRITRLKSDLREKLSFLIEEDKLDENRFEQELIFYAEKFDITEEIVRLQTHINYFLETAEEENCGKKLGFISQEMGREINTIGSKANDAAIQKDIVTMKEELEKIKEQVLNVL